MANYRQENTSDNTNIAVDWDAKRIPLKAYVDCLNAYHEFSKAQMGVAQQDELTAFNHFAAHLKTFYLTVMSEFDKHLFRAGRNADILKSEDKDKKEKLEKVYSFHDNKPFCRSDYITISGKDIKMADKYYGMFLELANWCYDSPQGNFHVYNEVHDPNTAFQYD